MIRKLILIFVCMLLLCGCASAAPSVFIDPDGVYIRCIENNYTTHNLQWVESQVNNSSILSHVGTTYYLNRSIETYQLASLSIGGDSANITKLVMAPGTKIVYSGLFAVSHIEITGGKK